MFTLWPRAARPVSLPRLDRTGNTLSVWFDDPKKEHLCEEIGDDVILMKDGAGRVIG